MRSLTFYSRLQLRIFQSPSRKSAPAQGSSSKKIKYKVTYHLSAKKYKNTSIWSVQKSKLWMYWYRTYGICPILYLSLILKYFSETVLKGQCHEICNPLFLILTHQLKYFRTQFRFCGNICMYQKTLQCQWHHSKKKDNFKFISYLKI